ncbi:TetR/AcrR family transcriptional regulator [uncultured Sphaerochaeta sp.]|uniref:TetR/AcrR family transcriptional regulator n=1 Tax=uncultured Sphaerochaeta sp. TaxID=886478 RepID=UPI002A0A45E6|nr:TetR/AcrR family transcriptional regulator [uncultured Sphaerochaeta sp.]
MLTKGDCTREQIKKVAKQLFAQKGYCLVTMQDMCEATHMSRGGLYRHFGSTKEIFIELLIDDRDSSSEELSEALSKNIDAVLLFDGFLEKQREAFLAKDNGFYYAIHEFSFTEPDQNVFLQERFKAGAEMLSSLLTYGYEQGVFSVQDSETLAIHLLYFFDNVIATAPVLGFLKTQFEDQLKLVRNMVVKHG